MASTKQVSYIIREKERKRRIDKIKKFFLFAMRHIIPIIASLFVIVPIAAIIIASFKTHDAFQETGIFELGNDLTFSNYKEAFIDGNLLTGFINTLIISSISILITVLVGSGTAYILSRFRFWGSKLIRSLFLIASVVPSVTMQVSIFYVIKDMNLYNTFLAAILVFAGTDVVSIYIFMQYIKDIPKAIDESAIVDGASFFTIYTKIMLPLLKPAIATVVIIKGIAFYNDFYTAYLYLPTSDHYVISTALNKFNGIFGGRWEVIAAGIVITMIPTLIAFLCFRKQIYEGVTQKSING